jgi:hypothetical protein
MDHLLSASKYTRTALILFREERESRIGVTYDFGNGAGHGLNVGDDLSQRGGWRLTRLCGN